MGRKYNQKFRQEWLKHEKLKLWVKQDEKDDTKGFCKYCKCSLSGKLYDLLSHGETKKHKSAASIRGSCWKKLDFVPNENYVDNVKMQEVGLSLFICQHSSNNSIDHLSDLCKNQFDDANKMRLHRTKCTAIIKNVLAPHFISKLRDDISSSKYSILVDESTDIGVIKLLGVVIIYFSIEKHKIVSTFLSLCEVNDSTAEGITNVILDVLHKYNLNLENLLGIGTDNANVMVGNKKSVYTELKKVAPNLILIRCVCHSVQLAVTHSWKLHMPNCLEYLVNETHNWFSRSYIRQQSYKHIYEAINDGEDPLKITNICDTRWLSIEVSISRIIEQWTELKTHFGIAKNYEKCFMAQNLYNLYNETNLSYLLFLRPILARVQILNKSFQSKSCDPTKLLDDMELTINFLKQFVIKPTDEIDIITLDFSQYICYDCYLGYTFEIHIKSLKEQGVLGDAKEIDIRNSCINFVINLILELKKRLPENYKILKLVNLLSVENTLKPKKNNILPLLQLFNISSDLTDVITGQYNNICYVKWNEQTSTCLFWDEVYHFKDSAGNNPFNDLSNFAIDILSLPWSNADVERVFSQLNIVKTKLRNRLITDTVNAVLHVRYGLKLNNKCCYNYEVPKSVLLKIGTNSSYKDTNAEDWLQILN